MSKRMLVSWLAGAALAGSVVAQQATAEGEVRKVDPAAGKITLKHGEIRALDLPPMTMTYRVQDKAALARLQPGDKVRFQASKADGQYTVTAISLAR